MNHKNETSVENYMRTGPPLDAALLYTEDEDSAGLDHGPTFRVVGAPGYTWNDASPGGVDEAQGVNGGFNIAIEGEYVWVARHIRSLWVELRRR